MTPVYIPQNLDDAILDLCRCQLAEQMLSREQQQRTTQDYRIEIIRVGVERQRQVEERQLQQQRVVEQLEVLQAEKRVEPVHIVQINQIMEKWKNEDTDTLDYKGQQNKNSDRDLNMDRNMQENILSNRFY